MFSKDTRICYTYAEVSTLWWDQFGIGVRSEQFMSPINFYVRIMKDEKLQISLVEMRDEQSCELFANYIC